MVCSSLVDEKSLLACFSLIVCFVCARVSVDTDVADVRSAHVLPGETALSVVIQRESP
jgi:hypothetical protein